MDKKVFIAIGLFWLILIAGFVTYKEFTLKSGKEVLLKTRPVDPRDLFRGDYVILRYEISTLNMGSLNSNSDTDFEENDNIFVTLIQGSVYAVATGVYKNSPKDQLYIEGKVKQVGGDSLDIEYGIESYFVPEGRGREIERESGKNLDVLVAVDKFGNAVIKSVFIGGKEFSFNRDKSGLIV